MSAGKLRLRYLRDSTQDGDTVTCSSSYMYILTESDHAAIASTTDGVVGTSELTTGTKKTRKPPREGACCLCRGVTDVNGRSTSLTARVNQLHRRAHYRTNRQQCNDALMTRLRFRRSQPPTDVVVAFYSNRTGAVRVSRELYKPAPKVSR